MTEIISDSTQYGTLPLHGSEGPLLTERAPLFLDLNPIKDGLNAINAFIKAHDPLPNTFLPGA
jgi:hypothetical protein